jgi:hypothetical protein
MVAITVAITQRRLLVVGNGRPWLWLLEPLLRLVRDGCVVDQRWLDRRMCRPLDGG